MREVILASREATSASMAACCWWWSEVAPGRVECRGGEGAACCSLLAARAGMRNSRSEGVGAT